MQPIQFQLSNDTLATYSDGPSENHLLIIPAGAQIVLLDDSLSAPSVRVRWDGRDLAVFSEALRTCAVEAGQTTTEADYMANEIDEVEVEDDMSAAEKLQLVDQLLLLSERCWSRTLKSCHGELKDMRERLLEESGSAQECSAPKVFKAAGGQ